MINTGMTEPKPRPRAWKSGPDPERHQRYLQWLQQKNQAQYRGEQWQLLFEQWLEIWGDCIDQRGRRRGDLSMIRKNYLEPWHTDNVLLVTRREQSEIQTQVTRDKRRRFQLAQCEDK